MNKYDLFQKSISSAVSMFRQIEKNKTVRLISHLDADGISAVSILVRALDREDINYSISIVHQLKEHIIRNLSNEDHTHFIFTDIGSGQIDDIKKIMKDKRVWIFDHHETNQKKEDNQTNNPTLVHINPHFFGIDGAKEISGSGIVYLFAEKLNKKNQDMAHIALIGAIGDNQEDNGFLRLNSEILDSAISSGNLEVTTGLKLFGAQTKALFKILSFSTDPFIPGVSGSDSGAIKFLKELGINLKVDNRWKKLSDLNTAEKDKLIKGIIEKRCNEKNPADVMGNIYTLVGEEEGSPFRDAKEFSTLLNACGRLGKASLGIGACLGDKKIKKKTIAILTEYKKELLNALNWFNSDKSSKDIVKGDGFIIINAKDNIRETIIGTFASIISKSKRVGKNIYVVAMAQSDKDIKISLRISGSHFRNEIDLNKMIINIVNETGGIAGGHQYASGALIPSDKEEQFIQLARQILYKKSMEEKIV